MLMMCWFYCIPFAKGLFFASGPLLILLATFVLKRGVRQARRNLRQLAFTLMFVAILKIFMIDLYLLRDMVPCGAGHFFANCSFKLLQGGGLVALAVSGFFLFNLYRSFAQDRPPSRLTPEQVNLFFWANLSISLVVLLILWLAAPWVGFLTVGHVPQLFMSVPWQHLALVDLAVILIGFWKLEDCIWTYDPSEKTRKKHQIHVWTAKDTLWVSVVLFLIALAFSYASSDVLSAAMPEEGTHMNFSLDRLDLKNLGPEMRLPGR